MGVLDTLSRVLDTPLMVRSRVLGTFSLLRRVGVVEGTMARGRST